MKDLLQIVAGVIIISFIILTSLFGYITGVHSANSITGPCIHIQNNFQGLVLNYRAMVALGCFLHKDLK